MFPGDAGSPRRRMPGQEMQQGPGGGMMMPQDPRQPIRPQLRPQRSLDNRIPSSQAQMDVAAMGQQQHPVDQQGNMFPVNNNVNTNTQGVNQTTSMMGGMDNQNQLQPALTSMSLGGPLSSHLQNPTSLGLTSSITSQQQAPAASQQQQSHQHPQQQSAFTQQRPDSQQQIDMMHRLNQQQQQSQQVQHNNLTFYNSLFNHMPTY